MDRRKFLKTSAAAAVAAGVSSLPAWARKAPKPLGKGKLRLKVGVLSDTHVHDEKTRARFIKALGWFKERRVDAVLIAGDMTDNGMVPEYKDMAAAWFEVFPKDQYPDGARVERLFVYGNHEIEATRYSYIKKKYDAETLKRDAIAPVRERLWEECWGEPYQPIYMKEVKGYKFIGAQYINGKTVPGLDDFFRKVEPDLSADKPFFYFQYRHPKDTCSAPWVWGQDDGTVTQILARYPNVVAFSGHSHTPLTDERTVWQGAFTSIGTASLHYIIPIGGRENSKVFGSKEKVPSQMPVLKGGTAHHGQLMSVYDDCIVLERREFAYDEHLGTVVIPLGGKGKPWSFEERTQNEPAPQFAPGAVVRVSELHPGKDRYGASCTQLDVEFPTAKAHDGLPRPLDYEVQVEEEGVDVFKAVLTKRVYSNTYFLGQEQDALHPVVCVFSVDELPKDKRYRFAVRPCNGFGRKGEPICSPLQEPLQA